MNLSNDKKINRKKVLFIVFLVLSIILIIAAVFTGIYEQDRIIPTITVLLVVLIICSSIVFIVFLVGYLRLKRAIAEQ